LEALGLPELREELDHQDRLARSGLAVSQDLKEVLDSKDRLVVRDRLVGAVIKDLKVPQEIQGH